MTTLLEKRIYVKTPYDPECIQAIKNVPSRQWHPDVKQWSVLSSYVTELADAIRPMYPQISDKILIENGIEKPVEDSFIPVEDSTLLQNTLDQLSNIVPSGLTLFPFQVSGVAFIEKVKGRAILGDQMGLGKTITSLIWLQLSKSYPALIIVPASLKINWRKEIEKWIPYHKTYIVSTGKDIIPIDQDIYIINYELLAKKRNELMSISYKTIILDECTYIKEPTAIRSKNAIMLGKQAKYVLALTGTPILNRPKELFNSLNLIDVKKFPSAWAYYKRYCNLYHNGFAWNYDGASNLPELREKLKPIMIRRTKQDVYKELPLKRREPIYVELPKELAKVYKDTELELLDALKEFKVWKKHHGLEVEDEEKPNKMILLAKLNYLRQIVGMAKAQQSLETIQSFVDSGKKLVIFGHHLDVLNLLEQYFKTHNINYVRVDGKTAKIKRQLAVDTFQNDPEMMIFLGGITATGMGITLTASSDLMFIERMWTPAIEEQGEDRCHRIGTVNPVTAWYFVVENTVDDILDKIVNNKRKIINQILAGDEKGHNKTSVVNDLLEELSKKI